MRSSSSFRRPFERFHNGNIKNVVGIIVAVRFKVEKDIMLSRLMVFLLTFMKIFHIHGVAFLVGAAFFNAVGCLL